MQKVNLARVSILIYWSLVDEDFNMDNSYDYYDDDDAYNVDYDADSDEEYDTEEERAAAMIERLQNAGINVGIDSNGQLTFNYTVGRTIHDNYDTPEERKAAMQAVKKQLRQMDRAALYTIEDNMAENDTELSPEAEDALNMLKLSSYDFSDVDDERAYYARMYNTTKDPYMREVFLNALESINDDDTNIDKYIDEGLDEKAIIEGYKSEVYHELIKKLEEEYGISKSDFYKYIYNNGIDRELEANIDKVQILKNDGAPSRPTEIEEVVDAIIDTAADIYKEAFNA